MRLGLTICLCCVGSVALADIVVTTRTIRPGEIVSHGDLETKQIDAVGAIADSDLIFGQEARVALFPGRPIRFDDIGPPALVDRNQIVTLIYRHGGLEILTEGRSLGRGANGEFIRVMNLASRATITGRIGPDGTVEVRSK